MVNENLGLVISEFNPEVTGVMESVAIEHAKFLGVQVSKKIFVPGGFDVPLGVKTLLNDKNIDAVVTLGSIIEGATDHDNIVASHASRKIMDLSLEYKKPVSLGIMGPKISRADALKRIEAYSKRAVESAVKMIRTVK